MKSLFRFSLYISNLTLLLAALNVNAHPIISSSESLFCKLRADSRYPYSTEEKVLSVHQGGLLQYSRIETENFLFNGLATWVDTLQAAGDPLFSTTSGVLPAPLCVGMFHETQGPNAVAIGGSQIVFGSQLTGQILAEHGADAGMALTYVLAHEFAHILQARQNIIFEYGSAGIVLPMLSTKIKELHADCVAGYILEAHKQIALEHIPKISSFVETLGDSHAVGDHGLPEQRAQAFRNGIRYAESNRKYSPLGTALTSGQALSACALAYAPRKMQ